MVSIGAVSAAGVPLSTVGAASAADVPPSAEEEDEAAAGEGALKGTASASVRLAGGALNGMFSILLIRFGGPLVGREAVGPCVQKLHTPFWKGRSHRR